MRDSLPELPKELSLFFTGIAAFAIFPQLSQDFIDYLRFLTPRPSSCWPSALIFAAILLAYL
jgi:hypothetical protein